GRLRDVLGRLRQRRGDVGEPWVPPQIDTPSRWRFHPPSPLAFRLGPCGLPRTTLGDDFDLLALRTRCIGEASGAGRSVQDPFRTEVPQNATSSAARLRKRLDRIADPDTAGLDDLAPDAEGQGFGRLDSLAVPGDHVQGGQRALAGVRVAAAGEAAADVPGPARGRLAHPNARAEPGVLVVRSDAVDSEEHPEPA